MTVVATNLACPIDGQRLTLDGAVARCAGGHSFDRAREGYVNLLAVQHKASRDPGDSKEMIAARRRFLDAGHYRPIGDAVGARVLKRIAVRAADGPSCVADAGCGEGYYLAHLAQLVAETRSVGAIALAGFDISKWAIKAAARRPANAAWMVASNIRPPFLPGSVDVILCLFGFPAFAAFRSVQKPGAHVILVDPAENHLIELRRIIYPDVATSPVVALKGAREAGYRLVRQEVLRFDVELSDQQAIQDILSMTPHAYRASQEGRAALANRTSLRVTAEVAIRELVVDPVR